MVPAIVPGSHLMGLAVIRALGIKEVPIVALVYDEKENMGYVSRYITERITSLHLEKFGKSIDYPCLVKPCQSHRYFDRFKRKMIRAENLDQMLAAYEEASNAGLETMQP